MTCNSAIYLGTGSYTAADTKAQFTAGTNNDDTFTSTLASTFVNGTNETGVPAFDAKTLNSFFDTTDYIGAVKNAADTWYRGWTCDNSTADFGSGSACTALPTT